MGGVERLQRGVSKLEKAFENRERERNPAALQGLQTY
jgi:hypothetical protein